MTTTCYNHDRFHHQTTRSPDYPFAINQHTTSDHFGMYSQATPVAQYGGGGQGIQYPVAAYEDTSSY